ncbi:Hsp20/alpha crystallin family protein [Oceanibaculum pacificum]|jgi:HSP20 family protein|uniref:SHSP domain-containing protein n=1 Tax=Oceanibaculum pacificum TaxID=580166 RepID=A0A154W1E9_9PROT|nr:Hsp20/alpha crystallin family protein [Oceanibaculum pacificum]KZD07336.1 hypothetical protein AUP43_02090 [Oceanibaculum pacificum]
MQLTQMGRTGWDPFAEMRQLQADMNRLFDNAGVFPAAQAYPPVNLWIGDSSVVVTAELPGLSAEDVELTIREDTLTISGERRQAEEAEHAGWHRRERPHGVFSRTIGLPFRVDPDQVQAKFDNGVLEVEMQRPEADRPRKIAINGN